MIIGLAEKCKNITKVSDYFHIFLYVIYFTGSQINIAEKAANVVSGFSTFTRRMNKGRRPRNLGNMAGNSTPQGMSKSTSEPMNLITDVSPGMVLFNESHNNVSPGRVLFNETHDRCI